MRGVGRSGHSRVPQNFPSNNGGYVMLFTLYKPSCASVPRSPSPTVDQPCPPSPSGEATKETMRLNTATKQTTQASYHPNPKCNGKYTPMPTTIVPSTACPAPLRQKNQAAPAATAKSRASCQLLTR